ncbi:MAG: hypothetical protein KC435_05590 [Thermomicrobiales bacterium]|nr:hypothetical protein [Thermomicrobiales bacterium]
MHFRKSLHLSATLIVVMLLITACGSSGNSSPTEPTAPPTASADELSVGDVIALADTTWPTVTSMRVTTKSSSASTEIDDAAFTGTVEDWTSNGNRHIIEFENGIATNEQIYADGVIYVRGVFVSAAIAPGLDVNTWVNVEEGAYDADSSVGVQLQYLIRPQNNAYGEISQDLLSRPVQDGGETVVGDRTCHLYTFGDEEGTGDEIRYEISVDSDGLPCQVVQSAGDYQVITTYLFDLDVNIAAPLEGTPAAATPEGATPEG